MSELLQRVYSDRRATITLKIISHASSLMCALIYVLTVVSSFFAEPMRAVVLLVFGAAAFVLISLVRKIINSPRPYECYDFYDILPKERLGLSFPSRHVFSAFIIGVMAFSVSVPLALAALLMGVTLAACRVLLGIHYIRDVVAGAAAGAFFGTLGIFIIMI